VRTKQPPDGSTGKAGLVRVICALALATICCGGVTAGPVSADGCPNSPFRSGAGEHLPDCRAYEQVSPSEKSGADAVTVQPLFPSQASPCEGAQACAIVYMNDTNAFGGSQGNEIPNAYIATRAAGGWQTGALTPPTSQAPANSSAKVTYSFSADLSQAVLQVPLQRLTEDAPAGVYNLFVRRPDGSYSIVTANAPAVAPQAGCGRCFETQDVPAFAGASRDFGHVIFEANDQLVEGAPGNGVENLYETVAGQVSLVGILPDGAVAAQGASAGGAINAVQQHSGELAGAISGDGSRVLFQAAADGGAPDPQQSGKTELYDRIGGSSTVEVSAPAPGAEPSRCETRGGLCAPGAAQFWGASEDGSLVLFTSKAALTKSSYTGNEHEPDESGEAPGKDLYRYDAQGGVLTDLTTAAAGEDPLGANVLGVVGSSSDGSYVYFVATGHLATGAPVGGPHPNLYLWHGTREGSGTLRFIATLAPPSEKEQENIEMSRAGAGFPYHSDVADWGGRPTFSQAYVTPDGRHMAFMSANPLTGYDNEDLVTHAPDHEVFEYNAETAQLTCASCDTSGARPLGSAFIGARLTERVSTPFHQPRALSDDGSRLFFSSPDPLVSGLIGGTVKVFEYASGAAQLISGTGTGSEDVFLDASASGSDVFFATREPLAPGDSDNLEDVYDARVGGGLPAPASAPPPCNASPCPAPPTPQQSFSVPISASFAGPGNSAPGPARPVSKLTRKQLLARALARCRRLKTRKLRAACIGSAKRHYGAGARRTAAHKRSRP
jgi:hypothetical protein